MNFCKSQNIFDINQTKKNLLWSSWLPTCNLPCHLSGEFIPLTISSHFGKSFQSQSNLNLVASVQLWIRNVFLDVTASPRQSWNMTDISGWSRKCSDNSVNVRKVWTSLGKPAKIPYFGFLSHSQKAEFSFPPHPFSHFWQSGNQKVNEHSQGRY